MHLSRRSLITAVCGTGVELSGARDSGVRRLKRANSMLAPRSGHTATLLHDGTVLIAGGMRRNQDFYRSTELFDPLSGAFRSSVNLNIARVEPAAVRLRSGKVLILGGWVSRACTDTAEIYDPGTRSFRLTRAMTSPRGAPSATLLNDGDVLIAGGSPGLGPGGVASAEVFRVSTETFERVGSMHAGRLSHTATLLANGRVLITGGRGDHVNARAEIYDPQRREFFKTGAMNEARYKHTAGSLPNGRVLIAGGSDARDWGGTKRTAEIYDLRTSAFATAPDLNEQRFKMPEPVALGGGQLLVAGGSRRLEIYDPAANQFVLLPGEMSAAWHFMTAMRLHDGRVLLAGGYASDDRGSAEAWLYQP
jgi:hypothetical protein